MLSLKQLRYFSALAETGHFGRAATLAGVSQPALSMQIRELEHELGGPLVERTGAGARLTELGTEAIERARAILAAVRDLEELGDARAAPLTRPIRLGVIPSVAPYLLPRLLDLLSADHPRAQLVVRETITEELTEELADGTLDAIVVSLPLDSGDFETAASFDDSFLLAVPSDSPHADRSPALAEAIDADELLLLSDGHCLRDQALSVCHRIDPRRLKSFGATSLATVLQLVAAGQGITLVPDIAVTAGVLNDPRLTLVHFARPEPYRTIGVAWRRNSPRTADFEALAKIIHRAIVPAAEDNAETEKESA